MDTTLNELYAEIIEIANEHEDLNKKAMSVMQIKEIRGFKRWHRYNARWFDQIQLIINCKYTDAYKGDIITVKKSDYKSNINNSILLTEHLKSWTEKMLNDIKKLGDINKAIFNHTGFGCAWIDKIKNKMVDDYDHAISYILQMECCGNDANRIYKISDDVHDKYKEIDPDWDKL